MGLRSIKIPNKSCLTFEVKFICKTRSKYLTDSGHSLSKSRYIKFKVNNNTILLFCRSSTGDDHILIEIIE